MGAGAIVGTLIGGMLLSIVPASDLLQLADVTGLKQRGASGRGLQGHPLLQLAGCLLPLAVAVRQER